MIVSIHQPAYLPWPGYFSRIMRSDVHVVLDHVQYEKGSFINRNRIMGNRAPMWLTVPIREKDTKLPINKVRVSDKSLWENHHAKSIRQYYGKAPYFRMVWAELELLYNHTAVWLLDVCHYSTSTMAYFLNMNCQVFHSSHMACTHTKSALILEICQKMGATQYLSGPLGKDYLDTKSFKEAGIEIIYDTWTWPFEGEPLSMLHLLMHYGPEAKKWL